MPIKATTQVVIAAELFQSPPDGFCYELIQGTLRMLSPAGGRHGRLANHIAWILNSHVVPDHLGVVFAAETGCRIASDLDTVLAPDVSFVKQERYAKIEDETGYLDWIVSEETIVRPDLSIVCGSDLLRFIDKPPVLIVEVFSDSTKHKDQTSKYALYEQQGVKYYIMADPVSSNYEAYELHDGAYQSMPIGSEMKFELQSDCYVEVQLPSDGAQQSPPCPPLRQPRTTNAEPHSAI